MNKNKSTISTGRRLMKTYLVGLLVEKQREVCRVGVCCLQLFYIFTQIYVLHDSASVPARFMRHTIIMKD